jgi:hypothetical protein
MVSKENHRRNIAAPTSKNQRCMSPVDCKKKDAGRKMIQMLSVCKIQNFPKDFQLFLMASNLLSFPILSILIKR